MLLFVLGLCLAQVSPFPTTSGQCQTIQQAKFTYALLGKEFEKQTVKQAGTMESLNLHNQIDGLKHFISKPVEWFDYWWTKRNHAITK